MSFPALRAEKLTKAPCSGSSPVPSAFLRISTNNYIVAEKILQGGTGKTVKIVGIIAEYNPFHNGHAYQIAEMRRLGAAAVVCVCSPGVVQRGEAAFLPARVRTRAALAGGADLILSLPAPCAVLSAEGFAAAGVAALGALGCVDTLCFGTDTLDTANALDTARLLESPAFTAPLRRALEEGMPLPAARAAAADALCAGAGNALRAANDILAVEYCKALLRSGSALHPLALPRAGAAHDAPLLLPCTDTVRDTPPEHGAFASASALRRLGAEQGVEALAPYVPAPCLAVYRAAWERGEVLFSTAFSTAILSRLRAKSAEELRRTRGAREGLENRLSAAIRQACTWEELIEVLKTKRYATARLRRFALNAALGYTDDIPALPPYLHILGATETGLSVLRRAGKTAKLPIAASLARLAKSGEAAARMASAHAAAEDFTALCLRCPAPMGTAYTAKPVMP